MQRTLLRSAGAIVAACLAAFVVVSLAPLIFFPIAGQLSPGYLDAHSRVVLAVAYVFGTVFVGSLVGAVVGLTAPAHPAVHMVCAAAVIEVAGLAIGGTRTLPHGWQVLGLVFQVALASAVAALTWSRTHRGSSTPPHPIQPSVSA